MSRVKFQYLVIRLTECGRGLAEGQPGGGVLKNEHVSELFLSEISKMLQKNFLFLKLVSIAFMFEKFALFRPVTAFSNHVGVPFSPNARYIHPKLINRNEMFRSCKPNTLLFRPCRSGLADLPTLQLYVDGQTETKNSLVNSTADASSQARSRSLMKFLDKAEQRMDELERKLSAKAEKRIQKLRRKLSRKLERLDGSLEIRQGVSRIASSPKLILLTAAVCIIAVPVTSFALSIVAGAFQVFTPIP